MFILGPGVDVTLLFIPRWVYNDGDDVDFTMSLPQMPWDFSSRGIGGSDIAGSGIPASFEIRRDYLLYQTLRFRESEWPDVERMVRHLQRDGSVMEYLDSTTLDACVVYGESPAMGEEIKPRRSDYPSILELDIVVRRTTSVIFSDEFYP